jgi:PAS domain S-box-containing protein
MPTPLAVLIVEDMESDAQLTVRLLKKTGYEVVYEQVETAEQMRAALAKRTWDIVISDYKMPQFDGRAALTILKETGLDIPFIIVSGTIGEETAVSMMKAGAQDYLIKGDLGRLIPAVERELEQAIVRRERSLAQEQLLLRSSALSAAANAIVITDHDGTIEWINPAFSILTGYKLEETIGKNPRTLVNSGRQDHAYYKNLWDTILSGKVWQGELVNRRKDGSFYTEEETITPLKNEDGTISYFIAIKQDISERKQAEDALRESEERYHSLFDRMLDGVYRSTHEGKFVNVNPAMVKMFGYSSKEEMLEMDIKTELYFEPDERGTHILDSGQGEIDLYRLRRKDGSEIWVEDRGTYIYDEQGRITYHEGIMRDVTKRVQAEQALAISESELRALVEQVPAIVYTESVETRQTLYISPQVEKLTG